MPGRLPHEVRAAPLLAPAGRSGSTRRLEPIAYPYLEEMNLRIGVLGGSLHVQTLTYSWMLNMFVKFF